MNIMIEVDDDVIRKLYRIAMKEKKEVKKSEFNFFQKHCWLIGTSAIKRYAKNIDIMFQRARKLAQAEFEKKGVVVH